MEFDALLDLIQDNRRYKSSMGTLLLQEKTLGIETKVLD